jgi:long-chain acyl-CoA synthetase
MLRTELIAPIPELLRRHATGRGDKCAYRDAQTSVTYADLYERTARLAGQLAAHGVASNDTVAIILPNSVQWVESCFAVARAGAVSVPISYDSTEAEIAYRLNDANCRAIITTAERGDMLAKLQASAPNASLLIVTDRGSCSATALRFAELIAMPSSPPRDPTSLHETAFILYTSGTTGRAKGVRLTVHGMLWIAAACWAPITGLSESDTVLSPLPLFHSYALNLSVLGVLATGASEYIVEKFSTAETLRLLKTGEFSVFPGVPTMFHYLLQAARSEGAGNVKFPNLRLCISAGAIMPATLNREFEDQFGVQLLDGYGITETSTMVTMNWPGGGRVLGSCGIPLPGLAVRIVDLNGRDVDPGQEGELIVRGPNVMPGYHNKPEETRGALRDGWYHTGDLARSDENGFLTITGRLKELIIRGGQNIAPAEIEEVVNTFEAVLDCAVVGVPHEHLGEVPALFVVPRPGAMVEREPLLAHCRAHLSAYKVPQIVQLIAEIPRTGSGKIIRYKLRETMMA